MDDHHHHNHNLMDDGSGDDEAFCNGMSMTMSMSGFQRGLLGGADCLTYLFRSWKLDEKGKYQGAMIYTFLLAILCEYLSHLQGKIRKSTLFIVKAGANNNSVHNPQQIKQQRRLQLIRKVIMTLLYGLSQCLGWSLMLISMTFSVELFLCVVMGTVVGKVAFPTSVGGYYGGGNGRRNRPARNESGDDFEAAGDGNTPNSQESRHSSIFRRRRR